MVMPEMIRRFIAAAPQPIPAVTAEPAREERWEPRLPAIGSLRAVRGIEVAPQVAGLVSAIRFDSGRMVEKGAVLVQLDDSVEQADLKRSEEHTSELQSLMRISYAVFCLKKKNIKPSKK